MAQDLDQFLKELFGDSFNKFNQLKGEQTKRLTTKLHEIANEAVKDELAALRSEIQELRKRVTSLEAERAADSLQSPS